MTNELKSDLLDYFLHKTEFTPREADLLKRLSLDGENFDVLSIRRSDVLDAGYVTAQDTAPSASPRRVVSGDAMRFVASAMGRYIFDLPFHEALIAAIEDAEANDILMPADADNR